MHTSNRRQSLIWAHKQLQCWRLWLLVVLSCGCTVSPGVHTQCRLMTKVRLVACRGTAGGASPKCMCDDDGQPWVWRMASCTCASSEDWASSCCGSQALAGAGRDLGSLHEQTRMLLSHFSRVRLCATPQTAAHQAPPSLGFSRQEHWSGLPFPSPVHESEK